jgi:hypothetical protein
MNVDIFDCDGTLYRGDLHDYVLSGWRRVVSRYLARSKVFFRFRYALLPRGSASSILQDLILNSPTFSFSNCERCRIIVTALPETFFESAVTNLNIRVYSSKMTFGFVVRDLYNRKSVCYNEIAQQHKICSIYSDSIQDFSTLADENFLVSWRDGDVIVQRN